MMSIQCFNRREYRVLLSALRQPRLNALCEHCVVTVPENVLDAVHGARVQSAALVQRPQTKQILRVPLKASHENHALKNKAAK